MKNFVFTVVLSVLSSVVMAFTAAKKLKMEKPLELDPSRRSALVTIITPEIKAPKIELRVKDHTAFLEAIGMRESSNNYKAVNQYGYLGKYQFGRKTLNGLGYRKVSNRQFLSDSTIQEAAMHDLLLHNKKILKKYIERYDNLWINGVYVTESGILAAAHLAGPGNVKKFFKKGYEFKDGNGTKMTSYMRLFAEYKLDLRE